jgi:hypothetical protein
LAFAAANLAIYSFYLSIFLFSVSLRLIHRSRFSIHFIILPLLHFGLEFAIILEYFVTHILVHGHSFIVTSVIFVIFLCSSLCLSLAVNLKKCRVQVFFIASGSLFLELAKFSLSLLLLLFDKQVTLSLQSFLAVFNTLNAISLRILLDSTLCCLSLLT